MISNNSYVLDVGCGDGLITSILIKNNRCKVVGIDSHPLAIKLAKEKNGKSAEFFTCSVYDIDFINKFDSVVMVDVFEHVALPESAISRVHKSLKANGNLIISIPLTNGVIKKSKYHYKDYEKDEVYSYLLPSFSLKEEKIIKHSDGTTDCLICWFKKNN